MSQFPPPPEADEPLAQRADQPLAEKRRKEEIRMVIKRFEDIEAWKEARKLTKMVYELTKGKLFSKDYRLRDQITAASVSTMSNTAEGFDSQSNLEFIRFLGYSRRSCSEVQSCLYVALDQEYIDEEKFKEVYAQAKLTAKLCNGLITYLKKSK